MKIGAAYIRVSDERQDEYSPDSQLKLIREYAKKQDAFIPDEYVFFDDGISAKSSKKRAEFNRMIGIAKETDTPFNTIYVWKFSRFARNQEESIVFKSMLKKNNVDVISISEPTIDGVFGSLVERIIEWMDEYYLIRLSGEVKRGMKEKASRGEPMCHPAFGYRLENNMYYPNEFEAPFVKEIFLRYLEGEGERTIAQSLGLKGVRTHRGNLPDNRFIDYILHNPVYIGKIRWSTDGRAASLRNYNNENIMIVDGKHEPIIDVETFNKVQDRLKEQKKKYGKWQHSEQECSWMLKGLVRCSSCGATLVHASTKTPSMQCHNYARGSCKTSHSLSINKANKAIIKALEELQETLEFQFVPIQKKSELKQIDYDVLIEKEKDKLKRCKEAYQNGIDTLEEYAKNKEEINCSIDYLNKQKQSDTASPSAIDKKSYAKKCKNLVELLKNDSIAPSEKNEALREIIAYIIYDKPNNNLAIYFNM